MSLSLSEYLLRDFIIEQVDAALFVLGAPGQLRFVRTPRAYFHLVLSGCVRLRLDEGGQSIELQAGDYALLPYGAAHSLGRPGRSQATLHRCESWAHTDVTPLLSFGDDTAEPRVLSASVLLARALRTAPVHRALPHLLRSAEPSLCDLAQISAQCARPGATAFVTSLVDLHKQQLLRQVYEELQEAFPVRVGAPEMGRMATIVRKMREHPERRWTVAALAREVGWSRSSFAAKFQAYAGMGPIQYAAQTRLLHAEAMLKSNPELPLWEVAKRIGYDTQGSFTRAFKAQYGISPRRYVSTLRSGDGSRR